MNATAQKEPAVNRKQSILMAAERLFAKHGYHGVSIRDIAEEAGVQFALVGYYYGNKLQLYYQIFQERSSYIQQRVALLGQIMEKPRTRQSLNDIVDAFVGPVLALASHPDGTNFLRMVTRGMIDQLEEDEKIIRELFDPLAHAFIDALCEVLPQASRGTVALCYQFALGAVLHHVGDRRIERLSHGEIRLGDHAAAQPLLVKFIVNGIRGVCGPAPATTPAKKTARKRTAR